MTERDLDWVTAVEHHAHEALLAIEPRTRRWLGVARYAELTDQPGVVAAAVIIDDACQGRGLGNALVARLITRAREEGHHTARASVLTENVRELQLDVVDSPAPAASGRADDPPVVAPKALDDDASTYDDQVGSARTYISSWKHALRSRWHRQSFRKTSVGSWR